MYPDARHYFAGTSEQFGNNYTTEALYETVGSHYHNRFQDESTPFAPASPYAVAKVAAHNLVKCYRESYGLHASVGILFNHETMCGFMPLIFKDDTDLIDILPISEIVRKHTGLVFDESRREYQSGKPVINLWVWDNKGWTKVKYCSGYPHIGDKNPKLVNARSGVYAATSSHVCIMDDLSERRTSDIKCGDHISLVKYPVNTNTHACYDEYLAELLGMLVADGNITLNGSIRLTNKNKKIRDRADVLWLSLTGCNTSTSNGYSGFNKDVPIPRINFLGNKDIIRREDIYTDDKKKKVPKCILNSSPYVQEAFLRGYNICDGLKSNPCTYEFKNFKTNSATLAQGLLYLVTNVTGQDYNITVEISPRDSKTLYYSINLLSNINCSKGQHLRKSSDEVKKIINLYDYDGWFYDLETDSGTFNAGVGRCHVHNSPRRGDFFVTKKITNWIQDFEVWLEANGHFNGEDDILVGDDFIISNITEAKFPKLRLGNIDASRDWGFAGDYVKAMWLMLQQDEPDDYVIATGETHTVREFLTEAFSYVETDYEPFIVIDPKFYRPNDVEYLCGRPTKAVQQLGWSCNVSFKELVELMIKGDINGQKKKTQMEKTSL
jgi:GDPmannose 4,6-dehydratase